MICPTCKSDNRIDAAFCRSCGAALQRSEPLRRRWPRLAVSPLLTVLGLLLAIGLVGTLLLQGGRFASLGAVLGRLDPTPSVLTSESVVQRISALSQLATARATIQTIVAVEDRGALGPLTRDRLLLRASADVLAGVDLGALTADDVQVAGDVVTITLPPATLVSSDISYQVYDRDRGLFAPGNKDLQSLAQDQARADILRTACEKGILEEARRNAEIALRNLLMTTGTREVRFAAPQQTAQECTAP